MHFGTIKVESNGLCHVEAICPERALFVVILWCVGITEEESQEQVRRMAAQAAEVDAARVHVQDRERQLQEMSGQLAALQQVLQDKSEEATRLTKSAEDAAAALAALQSEAASAASQKDDVIKALQVWAFQLHEYLL